MPGPELVLFSAVLAFASSGVFAYGPAPGVELIPYFLGLLAWAGLAFTTILLWPLSALLRRFRKAKRAPESDPKSEPIAAPAAESSGKGSHDRV